MNRPLFFSGLSILCAVIFCELTDKYFPTILTVAVGIAVAVSMICAVTFLIVFLKKKNITFVTLILVCVFFALGCILRQASVIRIEAVQKAYVDKEAAITLTVRSKVSDEIDGYTCIAESNEFPYSVILFVPSGYRTQIGDNIEGVFEFSSLYNENRYRSDGIIMYATALEIRSVSPPKIRPLLYYTDKIRSLIEGVSGEIFEGYSPFVESIILGGSDRLSETRADELRNAGLLHVTCVSGLHISIFIGALSILLSRIKKPKITFVIITASVFCILCLCSFSPSSVRAAMTGLTFLAYKKRASRPDGLNLLGLPMTLLLCVNPFYATDVSFLLSFSAVSGIHLFNERVYSSLITRLTAETGKLPPSPVRWLAGAFSLSLVCTVSTMPVSMIFFGSAVTASVISGIICLWAITPIYVLSLICLILYPLPFTGFLIRPMAFTVKKGVSFIVNISEWISDLDISNFKLSDIDLSEFSLKGLSSDFALWFAIFIVAVFIILLFRPFKSQKAKIGSPGVLWILLLAAVVLVGAYFINELRTKNSSDPNSVTVGFLDVGQGSCSMIIKDDFTAILDCGGTDSPGSSAAKFAGRYGDGNIDVVILSHLHSDHVNGIVDLLEKAEVEKIYLPYTEGDSIYEDEIFTAAASYGVSIEEVEEDMLISENGIELYLYTDHLDPENEQNDNSIVTKVTYNNFSVLFTGDITEKAEEDIVRIYPHISADILAVPHHGSAASSSHAFLSTVNPKMSVISVSAYNSYGHPDPQIMDRLQPYGDVLTTKDCGTIRIVSDGNEYSVFTDNKIR